MKLSIEQSQKLLRERGIWITEACDQCGRLLGAVRYTIRADGRAWCSGRMSEAEPAAGMARVSTAADEAGSEVFGAGSRGTVSGIRATKRQAKVATIVGRPGVKASRAGSRSSQAPCSPPEGTAKCLRLIKNRIKNSMFMRVSEGSFFAPTW